MDGMEGWVNTTSIPEEKVRSNVEHGLPLDCMWVITVDPGWKVNLHFKCFSPFPTTTKLGLARLILSRL